MQLAGDHTVVNDGIGDSGGNEMAATVVTLLLLLLLVLLLLMLGSVECIMSGGESDAERNNDSNN